MTGASKNAIQRLLAAIGRVCEAYQNRAVRNTLWVTPAMEAGITDHVWNIEEIVGLM